MPAPSHRSIFPSAQELQGLRATSLLPGGMETRRQSFNSLSWRRSSQPVGSVSRALFVSGGSAAKETGPRARIRTAKASRQRVMGEAPWREGRVRLDGQTEPESNGRGGPRQAEFFAIAGWF